MPITNPPDTVDARGDTTPLRDWRDFQESGLLWLLNTTALHPRGFALALGEMDDGTIGGWAIHGDGTEPWVMPDHPRTHECFAAVEALLDAHRPSIETR